MNTDMMYIIWTYQYNKKRKEKGEKGQGKKTSKI